MDVEPKGGGSRVSVTWDRTASSFKGRVALGVVKLGGNRLLAWATRKSLADLGKSLSERS